MRVLILLASAVLLAGCSPPPALSPSPRAAPASLPATAPVPPLAASEAAPAVVDASWPALRREFRGAWVASVANIDWPSRPGLPVPQQQRELIALLDRAAEIGLNAIVLQVRPAADALYASPYEPWSEYLTGQMGRAPEPLYDPLEFAVAEAHRRGLELHAWFNPYRALHPSARSAVSADHISRTRPDLVRRYGTHLWMDPGEPDVQAHSIRVILDVVRRYDIDGVHIDDYFYPYRERDSRGRQIAFPDDPSWGRYLAAGGTLNRDDWRRGNVDQFVQHLYREIKEVKPWVRFGISPFGIWRPGNPPQIQGFDAYEQIYADARKWLVNGWLDYFTPQLYWPIAQTPQSYPVLLRWWTEQNPLGRHIWPGNYTSRAAGDGRWPDTEIVGQILVTRGQPGATGNIHFSMKALMEDSALAAALDSAVYRQPALPPAAPWLGGEPPERPELALERGPGSAGAVLRIRPGGTVEPTWWVVRIRSAEGWATRILPGSQHQYRVPVSGGEPVEIAVSGVDRVGNEGIVAVWR